MTCPLPCIIVGVPPCLCTPWLLLQDMVLRPWIVSNHGTLADLPSMCFLMLHRSNGKAHKAKQLSCLTDSAGSNSSRDNHSYPVMQCWMLWGGCCSPRTSWSLHMPAPRSMTSPSTSQFSTSSRCGPAAELASTLWTSAPVFSTFPQFPVQCYAITGNHPAKLRMFQRLIKSIPRVYILTRFWRYRWTVTGVN